MIPQCNYTEGTERCQFPGQIREGERCYCGGHHNNTDRESCHWVLEKSKEFSWVGSELYYSSDR